MPLILPVCAFPAIAAMNKTTIDIHAFFKKAVLVPLIR
jgi:hypothetical protein